MKTLILVDIQKDYFPGGRMELVGALEASLAAQKLLSHFRLKHWPIIHVQHVAKKPEATFFLPKTVGVEIHDHVKPIASEIVVTKHFPNGFRETELLKKLETSHVESLVIAGMMTHMCIDATTRAAADLGFDCAVVHDACATRDLTFENTVVPARQVHGAFLAALASGYANVVSTETLLD
ncbi:MAG: cysteine hydrolase [Deltaproteobacteria bacterium]|nr:cysteine hydrolase [Deltaproteobacteria bacterium]